jgi:hypothetical protein
VDDKTGAPLSGVKVALMPWGPCGATPAPSAITPSNDGCPTPLPSPQVTTDPSGNFALDGVANGHYLLVIGNDVTYTPPPGYTPPSCTTNCGTPTPAQFTVQAVVHDNVMLTGGNQVLKAPTLPAEPTVTPAAWETNGDYRLATLDESTEMPCYIAWEYERTQRGLSGSSVDEWLTENVRAVNTAAIANNGGAFPVVTTQGATSSGGTSCSAALFNSSMFAANASATNLRTIWFGGRYMAYSSYGGTYNEAAGDAAFPVDPRSYTDPQIPNWP